MRARQPNLPHMRDVEEPCLRPGMKVLAEDAGGVLDRRLVAGKRHHPRAELAVESVKRRPLERRCRRLDKGHPRTSDRADANAPELAPSVVDPERFTLRHGRAAAGAYSFGERTPDRGRCFPERSSARGPFA